MEINTNDIVILKKLKHCNVCSNDTFRVIQTGTKFIFKCNDCKKEKTISAGKVKFYVKEVIPIITGGKLMEM